MRKNRKKKKLSYGGLRCIVILSGNENISEERARKKEDAQKKYIFEYADAHDLIPMAVIRRGVMGQSVMNGMYDRAIRMMCCGRAEAVLLSYMASVSRDTEDAYIKVGKAVGAGFRVITVDEGELRLDLYQPEGSEVDKKCVIWK